MKKMTLIKNVILLIKILFRKRQYGFIHHHNYLTKDMIKILKSIIGFKGSNYEHIRRNYEDSFAKIIGEGKAVSFASGRMAFYAYMKVLNITEGDEIILTGSTCSVMVNAVLRLNAVPIFCDIDPDTYGMSHTTLNRLITNKTKLIVAQHSFGIPCKILEIIEIAKANNIPVLEDCAISLDSRISNKAIGSFGDAAIFSTDHSKPLNTLIGGMFYTTNVIIFKDIKKINDISSELSDEHQRKLFKKIIFEKRFTIPKKYKYYKLLNFLNSIKNKITNSHDAYLTSESSPPGFEPKAYYPYPSKMPIFLTQIGIWELERWKEEKSKRENNLTKLLLNFQKYVILPNAYFDKGLTIIPHRFIFTLNNNDSGLAERINKYIDNSWIWFRKPIVATKNNLTDFGYVTGTCKVAELMGTKIFNIPTHLENSEMMLLIKLLL